VTMWALILALCLANFQVSFSLSGDDIARQLRSSLSPESGIYLPNDPQWQKKALQLWSQWKAPTFIVSVKPKQQQDLQKVVSQAMPVRDCVTR
jgi:hypothetical protein